MRKSTVTAVFSSDVKKVWDVVSDNRNYTWRSDIVKVEESEDKLSFTEYTKEGLATRFEVTEKEPYGYYAFDLSNKYCKGHWSGEFFITPEGGTRLLFTEELAFTNFIVQGASYLFMDIKKIQERYLADLRKALGE